MNGLLIGLLGALLATNQPQAVSNLIQQNTAISVHIPNPNDPAEKALDRLMAEDDAAMAEVEKWTRAAEDYRREAEEFRQKAELLRQYII